MPGGDRTGPLGWGSMTGRAAGYCAGFATPGFANSNPGRRFGRGFGRGWGMGRGRGMGKSRGTLPAGGFGYQTQQWELSNEEVLATLRDQARILQEKLNIIQEQIDKSEKQK